MANEELRDRVTGFAESIANDIAIHHGELSEFDKHANLTPPATVADYLDDEERWPWLEAHAGIAYASGYLGGLADAQGLSIRELLTRYEADRPIDPT